MALDLNDVLHRLISRGIELAQPAELGEIDALEKTFDLKIGYDFKSTYEKFNGFDSYDQHSQMLIWQMAGITLNTKSYPLFRDNGGTLWLPIGDFLIDSDVIVAAVEQDLAQTKFLYEGRILSSSIEQLLNKIALGEFDFGSHSSS